ncbi:MAG: nucleotidyltransferase family protein [Armatimonadota bacterium]
MIPSRQPTHDLEERSTIDVVVLAGGRNTIPLYKGYVPGPKALIPYKGKASIEYVLQALDAVDGIGRICVEGPRESLLTTLGDRMADGNTDLVEGGATFLDSLIIGLEHFRSSRSVLFVTADLPLITPESVRAFLAAAAAAPPVKAQNITGDYRKFTKPFNRFRDIQICHGNLFIADTELLENRDIRRRVTRMYDGRKSILSRLAFGWQIALTYLIGVDLLHILTLRTMASVASRFLGVGIIPVLIPHPETTIDVDDADDYDFVREQIRKRVGPGAS